MKLLLTLILIYVILTIILVSFLYLNGKRNYLRRAWTDIQKCPFGKEEYNVKEIKGTITSNLQGIISYSLFGNYPKYSVKLLESVRVIPQLLQNWQARVYVGMDIPDDILTKLIDNGAVVYIMGPKPPIGFEAALWRFFPAEELLPFVSLDADDLFDQKVRDNIVNWLTSGKIFLNLSTYKSILPMAAGLWGARPIMTDDGLVPPVPGIQEDINSYCEHWFGFDEAYLRMKVWKRFNEFGYYQAPHFHLRKLLLAGIIVLILLIIISLILAFQKRNNN